MKAALSGACAWPRMWATSRRFFSLASSATMAHALSARISGWFIARRASRCSAFRSSTNSSHALSARISGWLSARRATRLIASIASLRSAHHSCHWDHALLQGCTARFSMLNERFFSSMNSSQQRQAFPSGLAPLKSRFSLFFSSTISIHLLSAFHSALRSTLAIAFFLLRSSSRSSSHATKARSWLSMSIRFPILLILFSLFPMSSALSIPDSICTDHLRHPCRKRVPNRIMMSRRRCCLSSTICFKTCIGCDRANWAA